MKVSELAIQLKLEVADLIEIIKETGLEVADADTELDNGSIAGLVEQIDKFTQAVKNNQQKKEAESVATATENAQSIPEAGSDKPKEIAAASPASLSPAKKVNPSLIDLSKNLNVELNDLIESVKQLGITIEDPNKELSAEDGEKLLNNLNIIESSIKNIKNQQGQDVPAPGSIASNNIAKGEMVEVDMGQAQAQLPEADKAVAKEEKKIEPPKEKKVIKPKLGPPIHTVILKVLENPYFIGGIVFSSLLVICSALLFSNKGKKEVVEVESVEKAQMALIWKMENQGYFQSALETCEAFKKNFPDSRLLEDVYFKSGEILFNWKRYPPNMQYQKAIQAFQEAIKKFPESEKVPQALNYIAQSYEGMRLYDEAVKSYSALLKEYPYYYLRDKIQFAIGKAYFDSNNYAKGIKAYAGLIAKFPYSEFKNQSYFQIAVGFEKLNQFNAAIKAYKKFLSLANDKNKDDARFAIGNIYLGIKDFKNAIKYFRETIGKYPNDKNNAKAQLLIAECFSRLKDFQSAQKTLQEVLYTYNNDYYIEEAMFKTAQYYTLERDKPKAILAYEKALEKFPNSKFARIYALDLGKLYIDVGNFDKAIDIFYRLIKKYPNASGNDKVLMLLARSYYSKGMFVASAKIADDLIKNYPSSKLVDWAYYFKAESYVNGGLFEEAKQVFVKKLGAHSRASNKDYLFYKLGEISYKASQYDEAIGYFNESIGKKLFSKYRYKSRLFIAKSYLAKNEPKKAVEQLEKLVNNDFLKGKDVFFESCIELGRIYFKQKEFSRANSLFDEILSEGIRNRFFLNATEVKGASLIQANSFKQAQTLYQNGIAAYEQNRKEENSFALERANLYMWLGDLFFRRKDYRPALENYLKADEMYPKNGSKKAWILYQIGNAYSLSGKTEEAKAFYDKLKVLFPDNYWSKQIEWNIKKTELLHNIGIGVRHE